jgi:hypothetical protein
MGDIIKFLEKVWVEIFAPAPPDDSSGKWKWLSYLFQRRFEVTTPNGFKAVCEIQGNVVDIINDEAITGNTRKEAHLVDDVIEQWFCEVFPLVMADACFAYSVSSQVINDPRLKKPFLFPGLPGVRLFRKYRTPEGDEFRWDRLCEDTIEITRKICRERRWSRNGMSICLTFIKVLQTPENTKENYSMLSNSDIDKIKNVRPCISDIETAAIMAQYLMDELIRAKEDFEETKRNHNSQTYISTAKQQTSGLVHKRENS